MQDISIIATVTSVALGASRTGTAIISYDDAEDKLNTGSFRCPLAEAPQVGDLLRITIEHRPEAEVQHGS